MKVHKVIIHELYKPQGSTGAKLSKSLSLMDNAHEDVVNMVQELNSRYRKRSEKQGIFDAENPTIFHRGFEEFYSNWTDDTTFINFSQASAENLKDKIEGIGPAKGGYLVYAHYEDYRNYCSVFFVRDTTSIAFKRNKTVHSFDLNKVQHIDFEKLAMACRINMQIFKDENSKYLSFIHTKSDDLSQYFVRWISTRDTVTSEEDTNNLLKALRRLPLPIYADGLHLADRDEIIKGAHSFIKASPTLTINVHEMSKILFNDESYLANYIHENYPSIPNEFKAHPTAMRNFVKVYAKADEVEINFSHGAYKKGIIRLDEKDQSQLIIKSQGIVDQVRDSLANE